MKPGVRSWAAGRLGEMALGAAVLLVFSALVLCGRLECSWWWAPLAFLLPFVSELVFAAVWWAVALAVLAVCFFLRGD